MEDGVFLLEALTVSKKVATLKGSPVLHRASENSLMGGYSNPGRNRNMVVSFIYVINQYHQIQDRIKSDLDLQANENLVVRREYFIFFMFFRMIRYKLTSREIEENLKKVHFKKFTAFPGRHFNRLRYKVLARMVEKKFLRTLIRFTYGIVK